MDKPDLQKKGERAAEKFSKATGINLAAIDFVFPMIERDPDPLFLEINYYFGRQGLGGSETYYRLLHEAIQDWLRKAGGNPDAVQLV